MNYLILEMDFWHTERNLWIFSCSQVDNCLSLDLTLYWTAILAGSYSSSSSYSCTVFSIDLSSSHFSSSVSLLATYSLILEAAYHRTYQPSRHCFVEFHLCLRWKAFASLCWLYSYFLSSSTQRSHWIGHYFYVVELSNCCCRPLAKFYLSKSNFH